MTITTLNVNEPFDLPDGFINTAYSHTLAPLNNSGSVTWAIANGTLPPGLVLNTSSGAIAGPPTTQGLFNFTYSLNDGTNTIYRGASLRIWGIHILPTCWSTPFRTSRMARSQSDAQAATEATRSPRAGLPQGLSMNSSGVIAGTPTQ